MVERDDDDNHSLEKCKILCIIPARSGSQGVQRKNVRSFKGLPLLAHSIRQARHSKHSVGMRVIVSTDSAQYASIAKEHGAECPFLRPLELSGSLSTDLECVTHCLQWVRKHEKYVPDFILHLRPTQPLRRISDIDKCIDIFKANRHAYDSLRTVTEVDKSPFKMYMIDEGDQTQGRLRG